MGVVNDGVMYVCEFVCMCVHFVYVCVCVSLFSGTLLYGRTHWFSTVVNMASWKRSESECSLAVPSHVIMTLGWGGVRFTMVYSETPDMSEEIHQDFTQQQQQQRGGQQQPGNTSGSGGGPASRSPLTLPSGAVGNNVRPHPPPGTGPLVGNINGNNHIGDSVGPTPVPPHLPPPLLPPAHHESSVGGNGRGPPYPPAPYPAQKPYEPTPNNHRDSPRYSPYSSTPNSGGGGGDRHHHHHHHHNKPPPPSSMNSDPRLGGPGWRM